MYNILRGKVRNSSVLSQIEKQSGNPGSLRILCRKILYTEVRPVISVS
jgi:hypothetical protein